MSETTSAVLSEARRRILDTTLDLFSRHGYYQVGMRGIASQLGIRAPSLYSHYASKRDLLVAVVSPLLDDVDRLLLEAPAIQADADVRVRWLTKYIAAFAARPKATRLLARDPAIRDEGVLRCRLTNHPDTSRSVLRALGASDDLAISMITGAIIQAILDGVVAADDAHELATRLQSLFSD